MKSTIRYTLLMLALMSFTGLWSFTATKVAFSTAELRIQQADTIKSEGTVIDSALTKEEYARYKRLERRINRENFEDTTKALYQAIGLQKLNLPYKVFRHALIGFYALRQEGKLSNKDILSIIDFTQNSRKKRFYTIDLQNQKVLFNSLVSHGRNTGQNEAKFFSNRAKSNQSSLGFYVTAETYHGSKGYSLRLDGMEPGYNDNMRKRAVVMHEAPYVSEQWIKDYGRLGRSQGCPALPKSISKKVINTIKDKTTIFAYFEDDGYLKASDYLNLEKLMEKMDMDNVDVTRYKVVIPVD